MNPLMILAALAAIGIIIWGGSGLIGTASIVNHNDLGTPPSANYDKLGRDCKTGTLLSYSQPIQPRQGVFVLSECNNQPGTIKVVTVFTDYFQTGTGSLPSQRDQYCLKLGDCTGNGYDMAYYRIATYQLPGASTTGTTTTTVQPAGAQPSIVQAPLAVFNPIFEAIGGLIDWLKGMLRI